MIAMQDEGRTALAMALETMPSYFAWGRGDGAWQEPPAIPTVGGPLLDEIGRSLVTVKQFVEPTTADDPTYFCTAPEGVGENILYYKKSDVPTKWLYLRADFGYFDADGETVREVALFVGATVKPDTPPGHRYIPASQVANRGQRLTLEYRRPSPRERKEEEEYLVITL